MLLLNGHGGTGDTCKISVKIIQNEKKKKRVYKTLIDMKNED